MTDEKKKEELDSANAQSNVASPKAKSWAMVAAFAMALVLIIAAAIYLQENLGEGYDLTAASTAPTDTDLPLVGEPAPDFTFLGEQGHMLMLSDYQGTPVVLNFWASWCPPCRMEKPFFQQAYDLYGNDVEFLMINVDEPIEVARGYMDEEGYTFPIYFDEAHEGTAAFETIGVPETFFIDAEGVIRARFMGAINLATIEQGLELIVP